jgi:hypothetical protein
LERRVRLAARFVAPACRQAGFFMEPQPEKVGVLFLFERRVCSVGLYWGLLSDGRKICFARPAFGLGFLWNSNLIPFMFL